MAELMTLGASRHVRELLELAAVDPPGPPKAGPGSKSTFLLTGFSAMTLAMLPNDYHLGPRCSCRECLRVWPETEAQRHGTDELRGGLGARSSPGQPEPLPGTPGAL